mmetsp:Transcript_34952/g.40438  ORF Transcript_34952/g.40438 Transcript_34952/m.40438 type:complete len:306 (+) Transcript_34952:850-1767(+)
MSDNRNSRNGNGNRGRGGKPSQADKKKSYLKKKDFKKRKERYTKEISYYLHDPKDKKEFKIELGGNDTEKVHVHVYGDSSNDECLMILEKEFNLLINDGDLMKEETIGTEVTMATWETPTKKWNKSTAIKEVNRKFRSCLKGQPRDTWLEWVEAQVYAGANNYEVGNTYSVANFYRNQKLLAERELDKECVETLKTYMGDTKKLQKMKINAFIRRAKTLNNYLHELFLSDILVPVDYSTLAIHQRDDTELKSNQTDPKLSKNYATETFGCKLLWTQKSEDDNRTRIWIPKSLQKPLLNMINEALL